MTLDKLINLSELNFLICKGERMTISWDTMTNEMILLQYMVHLLDYVTYISNRNLNLILFTDFSQDDIGIVFIILYIYWMPSRY